MRSNETSPRVLTFPANDRLGRERLLAIAAVAVPVLQAALAMRNATMVQGVVDALCALPPHDAALAHLEAIGVEDAEVIALVTGAARC